VLNLNETAEPFEHTEKNSMHISCFCQNS